MNETPSAQLIPGADYCSPDVTSGTISIVPSGGIPPYLYDIDGSGDFRTDSVYTDLPFGQYTITIIDSVGCSEDFDVVITEGLALLSSADPVVPPTCSGDSDGQISVSVAIATDPITYDFGSGPQSSNTLTGLSAGNYTVTVSDGIGCTGEFSFEVPDFPPLDLQIDPLNISCFGENDGSILVVASGGAEGYTYQWSNNATKDEITGLSAGNYIVTVTDAAGCTEVIDADIIEPPELFLDLLDIQNVLCFGDSTGIITVEASGGTPDYEYSTDGVNFQSSSMLQNLGTGTYTVIVQDSRGCTEMLEAPISAPPPLIVDAGPDQTIELGQTAEINAQHTPPFRPVTYAWTPSTTLDCDDCNDPTAFPFETTTYIVSIVDSTMCRSEDSLTIRVIKNYPVHAPNVFSPNGDGINDGFTLFGNAAALRIRSLKVFSRWGSLVFDATNIPLNDPSVGWNGIFNGKIMNPSVFAYYAEVEFIDGEVFGFEGDVLLMR